MRQGVGIGRCLLPLILSRHFCKRNNNIYTLIYCYIFWGGFNLLEAELHLCKNIYITLQSDLNKSIVNYRPIWIMYRKLQTDLNTQLFYRPIWIKSKTRRITDRFEYFYRPNWIINIFVITDRFEYFKVHFCFTDRFEPIWTCCWITDRIETFPFFHFFTDRFE